VLVCAGGGEEVVEVGADVALVAGEKQRLAGEETGKGAAPPAGRGGSAD
jgi:hypothetical protein